MSADSALFTADVSIILTCFLLHRCDDVYPAIKRKCTPEPDPKVKAELGPLVQSGPEPLDSEISVLKVQLQCAEETAQKVQEEVGRSGSGSFWLNVDLVRLASGPCSCRTRTRRFGCCCEQRRAEPEPALKSDSDLSG